MAALLLGGAACQTTAVETIPVSQSLQPMDRPEASKVGDVAQYRDATGKLRESEVIAVTDDTVTIRDSRGCEWTSHQYGFSPSLKWSGCDNPDGTQSIRREGSIYPLAVGGSVTWHYTGTNVRGERWNGKRVCTVKGEARVTVPAGTFDTYHVTCDDPRRVRHYHIAPELGRTVIFTRKHKHRAENERLERVARKPAST